MRTEKTDTCLFAKYEARDRKGLAKPSLKVRVEASAAHDVL